MSRFLLSEHPQGTPEWLAARAGKATGSRAAAILATVKSGEAATRRNYRVQLVTERLTGESQEEGGYVSDDMLAGTAREPFARMTYEMQTGAIVEEAGFAYLPNIPAGCSVDGFMDGRRGFLEAKCPKTATHITYLLGERLPPEYVPQVTHNFWVTGCEYCDFVSFDDRLPQKLQLFVIRIPRDEKAVSAYEVEVMAFLSEVKQLEDQLRRRAA